MESAPTNMLISAITSVVLALIGSAIVVPLARRIAIKRGLLDIPNERSSHKIPMPRSGGIGIVAGVLCGLGLAMVIDEPISSLKEWLFLAALLAGAAVGFMDDVWSLPTALRMLLYLGCATGLTLCGAAITSLELPGLPALPIGYVAGLILSAFFIAWYTNLFNFMDGIDGIAGTTATVTLGSLAVVFLSNDAQLWGVLSLVSAAACVGFLLHNYPPASVFMGDGGAVFLGLAAGGLSLVAVASGYLAFPAAVLLMLPFVFDATFTLLRRIILRERFWAAHRSHIYQQLCDLGLSHLAVTTIYTVAAAFFAFLGLTYSSQPAWAQAASWWGSLLLMSIIAIFVVKKNAE